VVVVVLLLVTKCYCAGNHIAYVGIILTSDLAFINSTFMDPCIIIQIV